MTEQGNTQPTTSLWDAVKAFLAKYDECGPHIADAFLNRELRAGPYTWPTYEHEMKVLREAMKAKEEAADQSPAGEVERLTEQMLYFKRQWNLERERNRKLANQLDAIRNSDEGTRS